MAGKLDGSRVAIGKYENRYDRAYGRLKELLAAQRTFPAMEQRFARTDRKLVETQDSQLITGRPRVAVPRGAYTNKMARKLSRGTEHTEHVAFELPPVQYRGRRAPVAAHGPVAQPAFLQHPSALDPIAPP